VQTEHRGEDSCRIAAGALRLATLLLALPAAGVAATSPNACLDSATGTKWSQVDVTIDASASPSPVVPGGAVALNSITQTTYVPAAIFVASYGVGLLSKGVNHVPATALLVIDATATTNGQQVTNSVDTEVTTEITDPDGLAGTGDETATDGVLSVTYADESWTADLSGSTANFREHADPAVSFASGGGTVIVAHLVGGCSDLPQRQ